MVEGAIFIGTAIIAVTQFIKEIGPKNPDGTPKVDGGVSIAVAFILGILVAVFDTQIGVADMTIAQGIITGLGASGVVTVAKKI